MGSEEISRAFQYSSTIDSLVLSLSRRSPFMGFASVITASRRLSSLMSFSRVKGEEFLIGEGLVYVGSSKYSCNGL